MKVVGFVVIAIFLMFFIDNIGTAWADVEHSIMINVENFPDENFRTWILKQSYGIDGELSKAEIAGITSIRVINQKISNLRGIEFFTALKELRCSRNQLAILDISKNTALEYLDCSSNKLTALDVSKNTALTELQCFDNKLTVLDVSGAIALTGLLCFNNQLTTLDMSNNTALKSLQCDDKQLVFLDVSKNTTLKSLLCSSNKLTALDVSKNTALTNLSLYSNNVKTLDVSKNTALEYLDCRSNELTALDVSKNAALQYLNWNSNQLITDISQKNNPVIIKNPSREFTRDVLNEAFPDNTEFFHAYILIGIYPSFKPESQISIGLKVGEQHAQASFRRANISFDNAFHADDSGDIKAVVKLMNMQQKHITIPVDVVSKWISGFWVNLETTVKEMRDKEPDVITLDGIRYKIEVYTMQNKITLDIIGSDLSEKYYDDHDITSMLDWISPIIKYVKDAISSNDKK